MATETITRQGEHAITLDEEAIKAIRYALLIGLDSFGEVERLRNHAEFMAKYSDPLPEAAIPIHPTGSDETIGDFACALRYLG